MATKVELPQLRELHGFRRTICGCEFCCAPCRHVPGGLDPSDLERLCPAGRDVFDWAEEHLRARIDRDYPILLPTRHLDGHCHWLFEGKCVVHDNSPFGCAFFDMHMTPEEAKLRQAATIQARREDAAAGGLYHRVWLHLRRMGLVARPGDHTGLREEVLALGRKASRRQADLAGARVQIDEDAS